MKILKALVILFVLQSCNIETKQKQEELINVTTTSVAFTEQNYQLSFSGQLSAEDKSTLSFLVGGMVETLYVDEGQKVEKGQLLASLHPTDFINERALREASLLEAQDTYERMKSLYEKQSIPERDFIRAKAAFLSATAANNIARKKVSDTKLYAPFSGTIFRKAVRKGTVINPGQPIYEIATIEQLEVIVAVPESEINTIAIGDEVITEVNSISNYRSKAQITSIIYVADATTRSYMVKAKIDNSNGILKDGMLAEVLVNTERKTKHINVPGNSLVIGDDKVPHIFVYNPNTGRALKTRVSIGSVQGDNIQITDGLKGNETIITQGHHQVRDGAEVNPVNIVSFSSKNN